MSFQNRKKGLHYLGRRIEHPRPSEGRVFIPFHILTDRRWQLAVGCQCFLFTTPSSPASLPQAFNHWLGHKREELCVSMSVQF